MNPAIPGCLGIMMLIGGGILMGVGANTKNNKTKHDGLLYGGLVMFILGIIIGLVATFTA